MLRRAFSHIGIFFLNAISLLPLPVLYLFATILYWQLYYVFGYRKAIVRTNLRNSFPEKSGKEILVIEKRFYKYLAAVIFEIIKMATISKAELQKRFRFKNLHVINDYLEKGTSVLICSAHYGNWEWGTSAIGLGPNGTKYPIYKPLSNKIFDKWFFDFRSRFGNRMISMKQTYRALTQTMDQPTLFCFGNDQAPPKNESHYWINFLNQPTAIQMGVEKIAIKTNRPIVYIKVTVVKKGYYEADCVLLVPEPQKTKGHEITDIHARFLEQIIQEEPAYWLWSHKRWKHQPTPPPAN
jgi:KDO2-lipid IV(A) lauroyltransferase